MFEATGSAPLVDGRRTDRALFAFYAAVALIALAGQAGAAVEWLDWWLPVALIAVAAVEFGGIVLSAYADHRRRLGERAYAARTLSAAVAAGAVAVNWLGHHDHLQGGFFAGMSALGYLVWLLHSGARRRDQLRATGDLPPVAPVYGLWSWLRHPGLTRRARALALADPTLGLYDSLNAAQTAVRTQQRQAAIAGVLRRKIEAGTADPLTAEIAVTVYDLDEIAARLAEGADYDGLTTLIAADLAPDALNDAPRPGAEVDKTPDPAALPKRPAQRTKPGPSGRPTAAAKVAKVAARMPDATVDKIAAKAGVSPRTARRHLAAINAATGPDSAVDKSPATEPVNGTATASALLPTGAAP